MHKRIAGFIFAGMVLSASLVFSQPDEVQLQLNLRQKEFVVGEPVAVQVKLVNQGQNTIQVRKPRLNETVLYWIRPSKGEFQRYELNFVVETSGLPLDLSPGQASSGEEIIYYNYETQAPAFPSAGEYILKAEYAGYISTGRPPAPAEITVHIKANAGKDRAMEKMFSDMAVADFINGTSIDPATVARLEQTLRQNPKSLFSDYIRLFLAGYYGHNRLGEPDGIEKGISLLKDIAVKNWQLQPEAASELKRLEEIRPPVKEKPIAVQESLRKLMQKTLEEYFKAFETKDSARCLQQLAEDFRYNSVIDQQGMLAQLTEDFQKLDEHTGVFHVRRQVNAWQMVKERPMAHVTISYEADQTSLAQSAACFEFVSFQKQWFIKNIFMPVDPSLDSCSSL